jgi:hypothetical protein
MSVNQELKNLVAASSRDVLQAIADVPSDYAFINEKDESGHSAADYSKMVADDKKMMAIGLGAQGVPAVPTAFMSKNQSSMLIRTLEHLLESQILNLKPDDFDKPPGTLGFPIDCHLPTYYDCVVAHAARDHERADAIRAIFA